MGEVFLGMGDINICRIVSIDHVACYRYLASCAVNDQQTYASSTQLPSKHNFTTATTTICIYIYINNYSPTWDWKYSQIETVLALYFTNWMSQQPTIVYAWMAAVPVGIPCQNMPAYAHVLWCPEFPNWQAHWKSDALVKFPIVNKNDMLMTDTKKTTHKQCNIHI